MQRPGRLQATKRVPGPNQSRRMRPEVLELLNAPPEVAFARCRLPRYWPIWAFAFWLRATAALPWRTAIRVHEMLGRIAGAVSLRRCRIVRRNLELCFPELPQREIAAIMARHFACVGAFIAEIAFAWYGSAEQRAHLFRIEGVEHLHDALAKGKGVLLYLGHFTTLEICAPMIKSLVPLYAFMFRGRRNPLLDALQRRGRARYAHVSVANNSIRETLDLLRRNAAVLYAPDQARIDSGELVPFFSHPAMTSTAPSRLAWLSGATIVPLFFRRVPDDSGYLMRFQAPLPGVPSADAIDDTVKLTAVLESFVRECPEQYFWTHRKFKDRPGMADVYRESAESD